MLGFFLKRAGTLLFTLFCVSIVSFVLIRMIPGDPILMLYGERAVSPEAYANLKKVLGMDKPAPVQYARFMGQVFRGDFGDSIVSHRPVLSEFQEHFPATLELSFLALFFAVLIGVPVGLLAALKRNSWFDYSFISLSLAGYSMPIFWWGLLLILFFSVGLGWFPVSGRMDVAYDIHRYTGFFLIDSWFDADRFGAFVDAVQHLVLPAIVLATIPLAVISRMTRSSVLEVLGEDYIRTAKAKGLSFWRVIGVHALRNALIPVITVIGIQMSVLVTGAVLTETIFSWPGVGRWLIRAVVARDYPVIQGGLILIAAAVVFVNLMVDISYAFINPKVRLAK